FIQEYRPDTYKAQLWYVNKLAPVWQDKEKLKFEGCGFSWSHPTMNSNEAGEWVDYIHQRVSRSAFLPPEGFGIWSIFYLQRNGMPREQILAFMRAFDEAVRAKRRDRRNVEIPKNIASEIFRLGRFEVTRAGIDGGQSLAPVRLA